LESNNSEGRKGKYICVKCTQTKKKCIFETTEPGARCERCLKLNLDCKGPQESSDRRSHRHLSKRAKLLAKLKKVRDEYGPDYLESATQEVIQEGRTPGANVEVRSSPMQGIREPSAAPYAGNVIAPSESAGHVTGVETVSPLDLVSPYMDFSTEQLADTSQQFTLPHPPVNSDSDAQSETTSDLYGAGRMEFDSYYHSIPDFDNLDFTFDSFDSSNPSEESYEG